MKHQDSEHLRVHLKQVRS